MSGTATGKTATKTAKPSPRSGIALPLGAHAGNTGGKKGRSGRPSKFLKDLFVRNLEKVAPVVHQRIMDSLAEKSVCAACHNTSPDAADRAIRYIATLQQKALADEKEITVDDVSERVARTLDVLRSELPPAEFQRITPLIRPIWQGQ